jgi:DNA-binding transcriptional MocR family regulator
VQSSARSAYKISGRGANDIAASIEHGIAAGALAPGEPLPPIRDLATELSVNPNTVSAAYRLLRDRGAVETAGRRGTHVRGRPATAPRNLRLPIPEGVHDLTEGSPDESLLPKLQLPMHYEKQRYDDKAHVPGLIEAAAERLRQDGVPADHVFTTFGASDCIERVLSAHLRPGDAVAVEDPGWGAVFHLLPALGMTPVSVRLDDEGIIPESLAKALARGVRGVIVTSRAQNPTGAATSERRAVELRALLAKHPSVVLIEDDHCADLSRHHPLQTLAGATTSWAHVRSASKAYGPDLRFAVASADETTAARVAGRLRLGPGWVPHLIQDQVLRMWQSPDVTALIDDASARYAARRDALVAGLAAAGVEAHGVSGINVWIPVPDETAVVSAMLTRGWAIAPGAWFRVEADPGVRITVSDLDPEEVAPIAAAMAAVLRAAPSHATT